MTTVIIGKTGLTFNSAGVPTDSNAVHVNVSNEISGLTEKVSPVAGDFLIIEDSANSFAKRKVDVDNLPGGGGGGGGTNVKVDGGATLTTADFTDGGDIDFTDSGGTITAAIKADAVTFAKIQNISTARILGRNSASSGDTEELAAATVRTMLNVEDGATADQTAGEIEAIVNHDNLVGFVAAEHIDWTADQGATNIDPGNITALADANIGSGANIDAAKIGTGVVSTTEFNFLNGVTSGIQAQIDGLAGGGVSDGDKGDITVSGSGTVWTIDAGAVDDAAIASGIDAAKISSGTVSNTEFDFLNGVTAGIQGQIDGLAGAGVSDGDKGDITVSGSGTVWTIDNTVVTFAKIQNIATATFVGRTTAGAGSAEALTATQARAILNVEDGATADQTAGEIEAIVSHDNLVGFVAAEHIDWTADQGATNIDAGNIVNLADANIGSGANIDAAKIGTGVVSTTEFNFLNGVTSGIQAQIDGKAPSAGSSSIVTVGTVTSGNVDAVVSAATVSLAGKLEIATAGEIYAGTADKALTADAVEGAIAATPQALTSTAAAIAINLDDHFTFTHTTTENTTLSNPTNGAIGQIYRFDVTQGATARTMGLGTEFRFVGGTWPGLTAIATAIDRLWILKTGANSYDVKLDANVNNAS